MRYLALDLGTTFLKGAVADLAAPSVGHVLREPFPSALPGLPPLYHEVAPDAIVAATQRLLDRLFQVAPDAAGVVVCAQMHGMVLTDGRGRALSSAVTWLDQRAVECPPGSSQTYFDELVSTVTPTQTAELGNGLKPGLPVCVLAWRAARNELPAGAIPVSLADYVFADLSGEPPVAEMTMAASMGLADLTRGEWHADVLSTLGLDRLVLPPLVAADMPAYSLRLGGRTLPCFAPVGDHQAAVLGALLAPEELSLNISTGSQVAIMADEYSAGDYEVRPFFDAGFLRTVTRIPAGRALNALVRLLCELAEAEGISLRHPWDTIATAVDHTPVTDLKADISFFSGTLGESGYLNNLTEENLAVGHLFRAAFGSMAHNYRLCAERLMPAQPWQRLVFSGGLAQNFAALRDEIVAQFGVPARLCPTSEDTLLGLLVLATAFSGNAPNVGAAIAGLRSHFLPAA